MKIKCILYVDSYILTILKNMKKRVSHTVHNEATLRNLIAATGLRILLKIGFNSLISWPVLPSLDSNLWFLGPCYLQIWWITSKNNRVPLLYFVKLWASFQRHWWVQTWVTVQKCSMRVRIGNFVRVTLNFDGWPWKTIGNLFQTEANFVHRFKAMGEFKLELQSGNAQLGSKSAIFTIRPWNLTDDLEN